MNIVLEILDWIVALNGWQALMLLAIIAAVVAIIDSYTAPKDD